MKRFLIILFVISCIPNIVNAQCNPEYENFNEVKSIFNNLKSDSIKLCHFQFNISSSPPDVDFLGRTLYSCLSKNQVVNLVQVYLQSKRCFKPNKNSDSILKKLSILLDDSKYYIDVATGEDENNKDSFEAYIRNERIWIIMSDN
jgi:hypothetical protein